jgi:hypothetical protein
MTKDAGVLVLRIRVLLWIFIVGLVISGVTALPLETELRILTQWAGAGPGAAEWFLRIRDALIETNAKYPFIAYGTDWLAFAHFVIAIAFIGPLRDPVKNIWVIEFGMIACVLVIPFALVMGGIREIPFGWRLIDCSFGIFGIIPLWFCRRQIQALAKLSKPAP